MNVRRFAPYAVALLLVTGLLGAQAAAAGPRQVGHPAHAQPVIGHLGYLTKAGRVKIAAVHADGSTSSVQTIGPVSKPTSKQKVQVADLMASGDGKWLAWSEFVVRPLKHGAAFVSSALVVRDVVGKHTLHLKTEQAPLGFSGDTLVTESGTTIKRLDLQPTAHLVKIEGGNVEGLSASPQGVVDAVGVGAPPGPRRTDRLRLTTFSDAHTILHSYVLGLTDYRDIASGWTSGDGKHFVVERGNHQDFGGLGPSSLADEYSLTGGLSRHQLGHYGTAKAQWRMNSVTFSGSSDQVLAVWYRGTTTGATSVVTRYSKGKWHSVLSQGIAVAGNHDGYVVMQPGKWVSAGGDADEFNTVPTGDPVLLHAGTTKVLGAQGSEFAWIS